MRPRFLTMGEILLILQDQIRRYGGTYGVRDPGLLSSALAMPMATFEGKHLHKDPTSKQPHMPFTCVKPPLR